MSCPSCGSNSCFCVPRCPEDCPESLAYSAENINLAGVGVLDGTENQVFQFRGVRSLSSPELTAVLNPDFNTIDLTLSVDEFQTTETFANAATRANTVPDFVGQLGVQIDTDVLYIATGALAGNWTGSFVQMGKSVTGGDVTTTILLSGGANAFTFDGGANVGAVRFTALSSLLFSNITDFEIQATVNLTIAANLTASGTWTLSADINLGNGSSLDFESGSTIMVDGSAVPGDSVLVTDTVAGDMSHRLIADFVSDANTQTYGAVSGTLARTAYATYTAAVISNPPTQAEVQAVADALQALSRLTGAVLTDLYNTLKPSL